MSMLLQGQMTEQNWSWSLEHHIPSDAAAGKRVIDEVLARLEELHWGEQDIFGVHLALEEAVVNAIKHGNQNDRSKKVRIVCKTAAKALRIDITDEGRGFNPDDVPDPTEDEYLEVPSGRGLMLMRNFMTHVEFNDVGNQVVMEKRVTEEE